MSNMGGINKERYGLEDWRSEHRQARRKLYLKHARRRQPKDRSTEQQLLIDACDEIESLKAQLDLAQRMSIKARISQ